MKPLSLHERIRSDIEQRILSGQWPPGHRVPGDAALMEVYGCARMTVSKALAALVAAGLIQRRRRAGTVVASPRTQSMVMQIADLSTEVTARGQNYEWQLLGRQVKSASELGPSLACLEIEGLHSADAKPLCFEHRLISTRTVPQALETDFTAKSPGSWLLTHIPWTEAENRISAAEAPPEVATLLGLPDGAPCLVVSRRTWRGDDGITFVRNWFVAADYELVARFGPTAPPSR